MSWQKERELQWFKHCPIFKIFVEPSEIINIPSRHNDEYRMIVWGLVSVLVSNSRSAAQFRSFVNFYLCWTICGSSCLDSGLELLSLVILPFPGFAYRLAKK